MAVPARLYAPLVAAFESHGWDAVALPRRGFEKGRPVASREHDWGYADEIADIADAVAKARADEPDRPVIVLGHSLGSQLAAGHQLHHDPADGLVCVASSVPYWRFYGWRLRVLASVIPVVARVRGFLPPPFFGGPGARTLMSEWARFVRTARPPFRVPRLIATPTLAVRLEGDTYALQESTDRFLDVFVDPDVLTEWTYRHVDVPEGGSTHHVHWVRTPDPVADRVVSWWESLGR